MPAVERFQVGAKNESTYGTPVTVDRFWAFVSDSVMPKHASVESSSMGFGELVRPKAIEPRVPLGAEGQVAFEVYTKGFGWWLLHMLGALSTGSQGADGEYDHTATMASLKGDSFTFQSNRPFHPADTDQAFTFEGGKVLKWKIDFEVGKPVVVTLDLFFEDYKTATALASRSLPSGAVLLTWAAATVTVAGSSFNVKKGSVECDNGFDVEAERYLRGSSLVLEPQQRKRREIKWELETEFDALTQFNRFASATASGAVAAIVCSAKGPEVIGGTTYPELNVTIDEARFDEFDAPVANAGPIVQKLGGSAEWDGSTSPITIVYTTADSTP